MIGSEPGRAAPAPPPAGYRSAATHRFNAPPPLSLYVHIPWCIRKCPYCDFNSHESRDALPEEAYVSALISDLEQDLAAVWGRTVESVFIGGGTPSLFSAESIDRLLSGIRARLAVIPGAEITLEANPGSVDRSRFAEFRNAGITRISLGAQSFDDRLLERIGRIHDADAARLAAAAIDAAGFEHWNLDLMYGLPGQDLERALSDLEQAIALGPPHISHYQLTIEPNTAFHHRPPATPGNDALWEMQRHCQTLLAKHGFDQYEISAYASHGHRCRHNLNYWRFGDYLGIGAGAHAKLTRAADQEIVRVSKTRNPRAYLEHASGPARIATARTLMPDETGLEFMMNALRLNEGFTPRLFEEHTGLSLVLFESPMSRAVELGLLERSEQRIRALERGLRYLDELLTLFVPDA